MALLRDTIVHDLPRAIRKELAIFARNLAPSRKRRKAPHPRVAVKNGAYRARVPRE